MIANDGKHHSGCRHRGDTMHRSDKFCGTSIFMKIPWMKQDFVFLPKDHKESRCDKYRKDNNKSGKCDLDSTFRLGHCEASNDLGK